MNIIGKTTIKPIFFYTGKISSYITWVLFVLSFFNFINWGNHSIIFLKHISYLVFTVGLIVSAISLINLGKSTRLGLPLENTTLRTNGIYKMSRNPMYLGFNCITLASILLTLNIAAILLGIYSMVIYHFIILGEEKFLENRFKNEYLEYKNRTRRYI
jgi:protein-S-isoprenylcysteine O-methyltransferase Ste14